MRRAHGESIVTDEEEQPGTRALDFSADCRSTRSGRCGDGITDEWLSSWYPGTHMSQKMVIEAKRKEMDRFNRMKVYRAVTRESMERDEEVRNDQHQMGHHIQRN